MLKKVVIENNELFSFIIEQLKLDKNVDFKVIGNSMLPFFYDKKTTVTLRKINTIKKNDIVLFKYNNKYVLHRIIKIKSNTITCMGDGLITKEIIDKSDIIAKVISYENKKRIMINKKTYLLRVRLWMILRPLRRLIIKIIRW